MTYKGNIKPNYYVVSKEKIRGHHVVTPYASRPMNRPGEIVISAAKHKFKLNKYGYAITKKIPNVPKLIGKKKKPQQSDAFNFGYRPW